MAMSTSYAAEALDHSKRVLRETEASIREVAFEINNDATSYSETEKQALLDESERIIAAYTAAHDVLHAFSQAPQYGDGPVPMIGLSLSLCTLDLLKGRVQPHQVEVIISACLSPSGGRLITAQEAAHHEQFNSYHTNYWRDHTPEEVEAVLRGIPILARRSRGGSMNIGNGHWIKQQRSFAAQVRL